MTSARPRAPLTVCCSRSPADVQSGRTKRLKRFHPGVRSAHRGAIRKQWGAGADELVCLFVGNNFRLKGVATLVHAIAELRRAGTPARAVVVGREPAARYRALATRLGVGDAVVFPGAEPQIERAYGGADCFVLPTWFDACALVTFEAMACGLPVITTRWNGAAGIVTDGTDGAVLDDPGDPSALAAAIGRYSDPAVREAAGRSARQSVERFPLDTNCDRVIAIYRESLERTGSPARA